MNLELEWFAGHHLAAVLQIEEDCFAWDAWNEAVFRDALGAANCIGTVASLGNEMAGYLVYAIRRRAIEILNFAVSPRRQRQGIGTQLLGRLKDRHRNGRGPLVVRLRETNLPALLFFRSQGFQAYRIDRSFYDNTEEDSIVMRYQAPRKAFNRMAAVPAAVPPPYPGGDVP